MAKKIEVQIVGDASSLQRALNSATGGTSKFGSALGSLAKAGVLAAGAAGLGAVFVTLRSGIKEYTESAKVAAQTNAVIKSTGGIANVTAREVDKLAESLMRKSGVDDEAIKTGSNMILTFKNIRNEVGAGNDIFDQATLAVLDMDTAMTQGNVTAESMAKTSIRVGKALNDPIKGITALARVGVTFTEGQKKQIEAMVKSGNVMGAQKMILKELTSEFGGSAEAIGNTMPKQLNKLKESFNNFAGDLVAKAIPSVQRFVDFLNKRLIPAEGFTAKLKIVWEGVTEVATDLWDKIVAAWHGDQRTIHIDLRDRTEVVGQEGFKQKIKEAIGGIDWGDALGDLFHAVDAQVDRASVAISEKLRSWALAQPGRLASDFRAALNMQDISRDFHRLIVAPLEMLGSIVNTRARAIGTAVVDGVRGTLSALGNMTATQLDRVLTAIRGVINPGAAAGALLGSRVVRAIVSGLDSLVSSVTGKLNGIITAIATTAVNAFSAAVGIGFSIIRGVLSGLAGLASQVGSAIGGAIRSGIEWGRDHAGSTAEEAARDKIGMTMGRGVINGWIRSTATLPAKMSETLRNAIEHARKAIEAARDRLGSAFDGLTSRILRAFDAESAGMETTHEKLLREIDERRQMEDLVQRQVDAQIRLNEAIKEGDAAAVAAAQRDLTRATEDIARVDIEKAAAQERLQLDSVREEQRIHLEKKLIALEKSLAKEGATVARATKALAKLMASFGLDFETAGALVGEAFVAGLKKALGAAANAAAGVGTAVPGASSFNPGPMAAVPAAGGTPIVVNNYAPIGSARDMEEMVTSALARVHNRGGLA